MQHINLDYNENLNGSKTSIGNLSLLSKCYINFNIEEVLVVKHVKEKQLCSTDRSTKLEHGKGSGIDDHPIV